MSSRRRHTRWNCDWSSDCALPILKSSYFATLTASLLNVDGFGNQAVKVAQYDDFTHPLTRRWRHGLKLFYHEDTDRSEERRLGKERRARGAPGPSKKMSTSRTLVE